MLTLVLAIISLILQATVVYYGWKMARILNPVRFWTQGWKLYTLGNLFIFLRRVVGLIVVLKGEDVFDKFKYFTISNMVSWPVAEVTLQIAVSIVFLLFGWSLQSLYSKYFEDGLNIPSWKNEQKVALEKAQGLVDSEKKGACCGAKSESLFDR